MSAFKSSGDMIVGRRASKASRLVDIGSTRGVGSRVHCARGHSWIIYVGLRDKSQIYLIKFRLSILRAVLDVLLGIS
eukprot:3454655-Rhodomonas_salina.1